MAGGIDQKRLDDPAQRKGEIAKTEKPDPPCRDTRAGNVTVQHQQQGQCGDGRGPQVKRGLPQRRPHAQRETAAGSRALRVEKMASIDGWSSVRAASGGARTTAIGSAAASSTRMP